MESDVQCQDMEKVEDREYDFLHEDNITKDLFEDLSGYQKVLLGTYAAGYHIYDLSRQLGVSATTVNHNLNDASSVLFSRIKKKLQIHFVNESYFIYKTLKVQMDFKIESNEEVHP